MNAEELTAVTLARIETKLDAALFNIADHEKRIRVLESKPSGITAKTLWFYLFAMATLAVAIVALFL